MTRKSKSQPEESKPVEDASPSPQVEEESISATRKALIEEEAQAEANTGVLKKVARRLKGKKGAPRKPAKGSQSEPLAMASPAQKEAGGEISEEEAAREAEEILSALEHARQEIESTSKADTTPAAEEAPPKPASPISEPVPLADLREVALEGYEESPAPSPAKPHKPISEKLESWTDRIQYRTLVRMTLASLTAVVCLATVVVGLFVLRLPPIQLSRPTPTATVVVPTPASPIPMQVRLPGGWGFVLSRGEIVEGKWAPTKAEWLGGTEICRWVSLPYSQQLEAVMNTFEPGDHIDLIMTNYDHWSYIVKSVGKVKVFELAGMDKNYPSLLLILTKTDSDERLVVFAVPR